MGEVRGNRYKWLVLFITSISAFNSTLDVSIVNISLPRLTVVFNTEPSVVMWIPVIYHLVAIGLMLSLGRLGDQLGRKKIFTLGFALFTIGLIFCSLSQSIVQLIMARIVQATGAAMATSVSPAIVTAAFPSRERGRAIGIRTSVVSAGLLTGPVFGGLLLDTLDWRSIFYIRIPIGLAGLVLAWTLMKEQKEPVAGFKFDIWGMVTLFGGLSSMILFLNLAGRSSFLSLPVVILGTSTLIFLASFIFIEKRVAHPIVDLNLFRNRSFAGGNISLVFMFMAMAGFTFLMPFYLIQGLGFPASQSGLFMAVTALTALLLAPISGWLSDRISPRLLCTVGVAIGCLAFFLFSGLNIESSQAEILFPLGILGVGIGLFQSPNNSSILGSVPRDRLGTAAAMIATARQTGTSSGIAIMAAIFTSRQLFHTGQMADGAIGQTMLERLSLIGGFHDTLIIAAIICVVAIFASFARGKVNQPTSE
ncbi:MFS transporter [Chloroflexota bacterium]